jgi:6-phosphogluconolactonase (cycloisomerase 2 family)
MQLNTALMCLLACIYGIASSHAADIPPPNEVLFVADYSGRLHTVRFDMSAASLTPVYNTTDCGENPSWLFKGPAGRLWCVDEAWKTGNGSLNRFELADNGSLSRLDRVNITGSPVQADFAFNNDTILAAIYSGINGTRSGGGVQQLELAGGKVAGTVPLPFAALPTPRSEPFNSPRAHGIAADPTGKYVAVPDLGADKIHILALNNGIIAQHTEASLIPGSGPRHAVFMQPWVVTNITYLFVLTEQSNTITTFNVTYANDNLALELTRVTRIFDGTIFEHNALNNQSARAAEIKVSSDCRFITVSNRSVNNGTSGNIDSLSVYSINADGSLRLVQYKDDFGLVVPRSFDIHPSGHYIAVGQGNGTLSVFQRDNMSGRITNLFASLNLPSGPDGQVPAISHALWHRF